MNKLNRVGTVSYTHLDVYKRQLKMHEDLVEWLAKQERVPETIKYLPEPSSLFKTMFGRCV